MKTPKSGLGCLLLGLGASSFMFLSGAFLLYVAFIAPHFAIKRAQEWVETPCVILESEVVEERVSGSTSVGPERSTRSSPAYTIEARFRYDVGDKSYVSDRYEFSDASDGYEDWKREVVAKLKPGTKTVCYVNPDDPAQAVLSRAFSMSYWGLLVPFISMALGLIGIAFTLFGIKVTRSG